MWLTYFHICFQLFSLSSLKCLPKYLCQYSYGNKLFQMSCGRGIHVFCNDDKFNWRWWKDKGISKSINISHSFLSIILIAIQTHIFCITSWWSNSTCLTKAVDAYIVQIATWFEKYWFILITTCLFISLKLWLKDSQSWERQKNLSHLTKIDLTLIFLWDGSLLLSLIILNDNMTWEITNKSILANDQQLIKKNLYLHD